MAALQLLLDKLNSGNIPMSREMWEKMQGGEAGNSTSKFNINRTGGAQTTQDQAELLRRQNGEKMELERDLEKDEKEALDGVLQDQDAKRRGIMDGLGQALAVKLQGDLEDSEVKDILSKHDHDLEAALAAHNKEKDRYLDGLRHKLAERRKQRESMLREKHQREAEQAGLPKPVVGADDLDIKLKTEQELMNTLHSEEMAGSAKSESDAVPAISDIHRKKMSKGIKQKLKSLGDEKLVQEELVDRLLQSQLQQEAELQQKMRNRQQQQMEATRRKMADRRRQRLNNLRDKQEKEMAELSTKVIQDGNPEQLDRLKKSLDDQHRQEREAAEAELDAQENEQIRQATLAIDEDHTVSLKDIHRDILKQINKQTLPGQELAVQRMLEDYKQELSSLDAEMTSEKNRQLSDIQGKIAARRARRLRDAQRRMEERAAQKFVEEQTLQMKQAGSGTGETPGADLHHMPEVKYGESIQEQALKKEQQRAKEELRKRQKQDREQLATKLEQEATGQEQGLRNSLDMEREKILRERKNKLAAEAAARSDLSQEQLAALLASHQQELDDLADRLDTERDRQQLAMREKMAHRRKRKMDQLRRKQEAEMTQEMLEQKKEVDEIKLKQAKAVEQKAIEEGIRQNGQEDSDKVIKAVLANRHAQELRDLESQFAAQKKVIVDGALSKLHDKYDNERDVMLKRHQDELNELQNQGLGPQELQDRRADLLNRQQMELSDLDRRLAADEKEIERGALADWEVQFARAQLELKEKHYKEFAEALKRYSPENEDAGQAEMAAEELEEVKQRLDEQRREQEERLKKEQKEFEKAEKKRLDSEMEEYARQLEEDTKRDKEKHEKNIQSLNKRKDDLVKERKQKMQEELERLKTEGASKSEQERIMQQHERDLQSLLNKMEADRLRMNTSLQERIRKRKEEKLKKKQEEVKDNLREEKRDLESRQRSERDRLKADEMLTLQETLNIDLLSRQDPVGSSAPAPQEVTPLTSAPASQPEALPETYNMAAPLNEAELMSLLMASPLYKKLESMKQTLANGANSSTPTAGDSSLDSRDADWANDKELQPVDLNKVTSRSFIVYKFGCFIADLVGRHCHHAPVTILLADKIPANEHLSGNLYRNSFHFDANNRILYLRSARLDSVGEFVLVMVHCLAHIKSGDLRDDANPAFVKEYQRALTVICDDLFFARFNRSSSALSKPNANSDQAAEKLLQNLFNNHHNEDGKSRVVEDLLDVKLLPTVDSQGLRFTQDRIEDRLSKYSNFSMTDKLQSMLGGVSDKMVQAEAQGATPAVNRRIGELSQKYSTAGTTVLTRHVPPSFVQANMTGTALYNTVFNSIGNQGETTSTTEDTKENTQDKYDNLCADFAEVNQNILKVSETIGALETEVTAEMDLAEKGGSKDRGKHDNLRKAASGKLTQAKSDLAKLELDKKRILDLMNDNKPHPDPDAEQ